MKGDVKRNISPLTGGQSFFRGSQPHATRVFCFLPVAALWPRAATPSLRQGIAKVRFILLSRRRQAVPETWQANRLSGGWQPWFYLRLEAYSFLGLSEEAQGQL